ncbi:MAG: hypothetical protein ACR2G5_11825 [Pyrinomonadaceae bacterium]
MTISTSSPGTVEGVKTFLAATESSKASQKEVTVRISLVTREDDNNILFETQDRTQKRWIHRNYIRK